jgi:hypothetical protein
MRMIEHASTCTFYKASKNNHYKLQLMKDLPQPAATSRDPSPPPRSSSTSCHQCGGSFFTISPFLKVIFNVCSYNAEAMHKHNEFMRQKLNKIEERQNAIEAKLEFPTSLIEQNYGSSPSPTFVDPWAHPEAYRCSLVLLLRRKVRIQKKRTWGDLSRILTITMRA